MTLKTSEALKIKKEGEYQTMDLTSGETSAIKSALEKYVKDTEGRIKWAESLEDDYKDEIGYTKDKYLEVTKQQHQDALGALSKISAGVINVRRFKYED
ncbi:hypothetical protein [Paenibacillus campinasensis]|uniref:Uncharacterized protein n=1 Tax=Paenibacillus campinasensis TaxID=66347 RepID=A0A268EI90_9BACL|nr:hypothetical protein [Paenibacillus campinasensis]PAD72819.1 hypothetical protein CHH67_21155 [Paenibacillus campinasensis]